MALLNASTLTYWVGNNLTCWYVASILFLYLITPFYLKMWKKHPWLNGAAIGFMLVFGYLGVIQLGLLSHLGLMLLRVPVYLTGLYLGKAVKEEKVFRINLVWAGILAVFLVAVVVITVTHGTELFPGTIKYLVYCPLAVLCSIVLSYVPAGKILSFFGRRSLEIYLLYEKTIEYMCNTRLFWGLFSDTNVLFALVAFAIAMVGAEILARLGELILKMGNLYRWVGKFGQLR